MTELLVDPLFGRLVWDEGFLAWMGEGEWRLGQTVVVLLGLDRDGSGDLPTIHASWDWFRANEAYVRQALADDLLEWTNEAFGQDRSVSNAEFLEIVELHQIRLEEDGSLRVLYNDAHSFGGHVFWADLRSDKVFQGTSV